MYWVWGLGLWGCGLYRVLGFRVLGFKGLLLQWDVNLESFRNSVLATVPTAMQRSPTLSTVVLSSGLAEP